MPHEGSDAEEDCELQRSRHLTPTSSIHCSPLNYRPRALALSMEGERDDSALASTSSSASTVHNGAKRRLIDVSDGERVTKKRKKDAAEMHNRRLRAYVTEMMKEIRMKLPQLDAKYEGGALRNTRTPGRNSANTPNTISMGDLIHTDYLCAGLVFAFCIENDLLFSYFPFSTSKRPQVHRFHEDAPEIEGPRGRRKRRARGLPEKVRRQFQGLYPPFMGSRCAHSKLMVLVYPDFLRVVITSANFMAIDVELGDNTWFIQDFPRISPPADDDESQPEYVETTFERDLKRHIEQLGCPEDFLDRYFKPGKFDFSGVKVHLVTSVPGNYFGTEATEYGQLALRRIVRKKILRSYKVDKLPKMTFEICTASVGHLENEDVVKNFLESCAGNRQESIEGKPELKFVFPTLRDVQKSHLGIDAASNISCHIDWRALPEKGAEYLSDVFYHYRSRDPGCLFHMKVIFALHADNPKATPLYMYTGSANFSMSAWGVVRPDLRNGVIARTLALERLEKVANYECGVVIKGEDIVGMLETDRWRDIVPYQRPTEANRYKEGEKPFRVSKYNTNAPIDRDSDSGDDEDEENMSRSTQDLVRLLSKKTVLRLVCQA
ncbi:tyrosyl-DNA phosphodiesterase-domain-containing protein [Mycena metata]|uniref:Tyrosyl-DNA phosphodiesterase-domain-containing protein n=1 Tax=Mycena metata TaxID=1033252 RepID=A0AAD7GT97_9AGAR|nr:tyrosyl-DNA phosphodiesterase-domain-containing protein [Mycena metata]